MASTTIRFPRWVETPPATFDIVTCYFPETNPEPGTSPKLRPALVINVYRGRTTGAYAAEVAYGTKILRLGTRRAMMDLVIQNAADLSIMGLPVATRFDLDKRARLPWTAEFFSCWKRWNTPKIGSLTEYYAKEYAYLMMLRTRQEPDE